MGLATLAICIVCAVVLAAAALYLKVGFVEGWHAFEAEDFINRLFWASLCGLIWLPVHRSGGGSMQDL